MADVQSNGIMGLPTPFLVTVFSIIFGTIGLVIAYFINRSRSANTSTEPTPSETSTDYREARSEPLTVPGGTKRGKNKKRREAQQEFTHSWMAGTLKGHTAPVLDMDYASNGKFLASCAEDCDLAPEELDPGGAGGGINSQNEHLSSAGRKTTRKASGDEDEVASPTPTPPKRDRTILSRRQRKNRTRAPRDVGLPSSSSSSSSSGENSSSSPNSTPPGVRRNRAPTTGTAVNVVGSGSSTKNRKSRASGGGTDQYRSKLHAKLNLSDAAVGALLHRYLLRGDQLLTLGYPVEGAYCPGRAIILKDSFTYRSPPNLDANAREFVPSERGKTYSEIAASWSAKRADRADRSGDSGHCSGSSLESSDVEPESSDCSDKSSDIVEGNCSTSLESGEICVGGVGVGVGVGACAGLERICARCSRSFHVSAETGEYLSVERCVHHWGKLRDNEWGCCGARSTARGCSSAKCHVWTGVAPGLNGPLEGYIRTRPRKTPPPDGCYGVYALDCEMCFTKNGLELAKITVVGIDGRLVYDTLVRPEAEVIDYNTRFSGITAKDLSKSPKSLRDVQNDLMGFINADTILVGHGLENDLRALRMLHSSCVDTVVAFPHYLGLPYRRSLKSLARALLRRDIQNGQHDSLEDARTAAELMLWRLRRDLS